MPNKDIFRVDSVTGEGAQPLHTSYDGNEVPILPDSDLTVNAIENAWHSAGANIGEQLLSSPYGQVVSGGTFKLVSDGSSSKKKVKKYVEDSSEETIPQFSKPSAINSIGNAPAKSYASKYRKASTKSPYESSPPHSLNSFDDDDEIHEDTSMNYEDSVSLNTGNLPPMESNLEHEEMIRRGINFIRTPDSTNVTITVIDTEERSKNTMPSVSCVGEPLLGYAYDRSRDVYQVFCAATFPLGSVPLAYKIKMEGAVKWETRIPLPDDLIERSLTTQQRRLLAQVKEAHPSPRYKILYVQSIDC